MLERLLRTAALAASAIAILSFGLFALDESRAASRRSAEEIAGARAAREPDPSPRQERAREAAHSDARELIDDANDVLISPFTGVGGDARDKWVRRGVPGLLALVVFGFGLSFLARFARGRS